MKFSKWAPPHAGARIVTDLDGKLIEIVGIDPQQQQVTVKSPSKNKEWKLTVGPNQAYRLDQAKPAPYRTAPFDAPHPATNKTRR